VAQYIEEKVAELERQFLALGQKNDQVLTGTIEGRIRRLEEIVEHLFGVGFRALEREQQTTQFRLAELNQERITYKRRRALKKAKPAKRKRAAIRR
jgi:hypothetical protein